MTKKGIYVLEFAMLLLSGCAFAETDDSEQTFVVTDACPDYFQPVVQELEKLEEEKDTVYGTLTAWREEMPEFSEWSDTFEGMTYTLRLGEEAFTFDLGDALGDSDEEWNWSTEGVFREEEQGTVYVLLTDMSYLYHAGDGTPWNRQPQLLLLEAFAEGGTKVTPYEVEPVNSFYWINFCYRLRDSIYFGGPEALGTIDLKTGELQSARKNMLQQRPMRRRFLTARFIP